MFRRNFGEKRNEEELCNLYVQLNARNWQNLVELIECNKQHLKKIYSQKDKNRYFRES